MDTALEHRSYAAGGDHPSASNSATAHFLSRAGGSFPGFLLLSPHTASIPALENDVNAPSTKNDGMGSLYYSGDGTARFRVWAPFAAQVDVILDHPVANTIFALAHEAGTPNWSADGIPAPPNTRYQYRITTAPGQDNDTSQPHIRTDARALQVEGSDAACHGLYRRPRSL
jgi:hypothetical protein